MDLRQAGLPRWNRCECSELVPEDKEMRFTLLVETCHFHPLSTNISGSPLLLLRLRPLLTGSPSEGSTCWDVSWGVSGRTSEKRPPWRCLLRERLQGGCPGGVTDHCVGGYNNQNKFHPVYHVSGDLVAWLTVLFTQNFCPVCKYYPSSFVKLKKRTGKNLCSSRVIRHF